MAWKTYKKFAKRKAKKAVRAVKKRYTKPSGNVNVARLAKDVYAIQRSLNVEHKHIDYQIGNNGAIASQRPTKQTPVIIPLNTPAKGTAYNQRVGNQLRVVHMTSKLEFVFHNNTDLTQRQTCRARIIFAKDADDVPSITNLLEPDSNGHYTPMSFTNTQEYKKYVWLNKLAMLQSFTQPTNRYPQSSYNSQVLDPNGNSGTIDVTTPRDSLNISSFYQNKSTKCSIKMMFENNSDNVETMKPYLVLTSDVIENSTSAIDYDYINVSGQIRMTYVDN